MERVLLVLLIPLFFLLSKQVNAQKNYIVTHYTGDNGLPQNSIKGIAADAEGFIWLGTEDGLVRYDGRNFFVFNRFNLGVKISRVTSMHRTLRTKSPEEFSQTGRERNQEIDVYFNAEAGKIKKGTASLDSDYVSKRRSLLKSFRSINMVVFESEGLPNPLGNGVAQLEYMFVTGDGNQDFFICNKKQIRFYAGKQKKYVIDFEADNLNNFFTLGNRLYYYKNDNSFICFYNKARNELPLTGDILNFPDYEKQKKNTRIFWNQVSDQAFLYLGKNTYILEQEKSGKLITRLLVEDFDLTTKGIGKIHYDRINQKLYLGSGTDGLFVLTRQQFQTVQVDGDNDKNVFYSQIPYDYNSVLTSTGLIAGKDLQTGQPIDKKSTLLQKINPGDRGVIIRDKNNTIWVKSGDILFHLDKKAEKLTEKWSFKRGSPPFMYEIKTLREGTKNQIWMGVNIHGLYKIDLENVAAGPQLFIKAPLQQITCLESKGTDRLLAGTTTGLYSVNTSSKKVQLVEGTEGLYIKDIYVADDGNVWFTALEMGLMLLNPAGEVVKFPLDREKYLASPHCIINDGLGYFWIPTNKGLFQMALKDLLRYAKNQINGSKNDGLVGGSFSMTELFYNYHTKNEGFNTNEFNGGCEPCGSKLDNGNISLPSLNGLVWFRPENIRSSNSDGNIILDKVEINRKVMESRNDTIYFPYDPRYIRLHFSTAYFGNQYNLNTSYALVKPNSVVLPSDWTPINKEDMEIEFSNLKSGNYTLIVRKLNGFGVNNYTIKKIYFIVPLLWYQTIWANVLFICFLFGAIYFYNRYNVRAIKRENAKLEELVSRRTSRLNETLMDLEESKNEMTQQVHMLSRLLTSMTHDIQSPLNYIRLTSGNIPKMLQKGQYGDVAMLGEMISDSSRSMSNLLSGLLDYIKAHVFENSLHFEPINLRHLVDEKFGIFKNMIIENGSEFSNDIPDGTQVYCDYQMLGIMIHNLIDNAAKFTRQGKIRIYYNLNNESEKELVISNTTLGVPMEIQDMINAPENRNISLPVLPGQARTSLGLLIVKEIATLVGISLKVSQSNVTSFHMTFNRTA